MVVKLKNLL